MFDKIGAHEVELKLNENITMKVNANDIFQGAKDQASEAIKRAGKQLPNIPKLDLRESMDDSFSREYRERN